MGTIDWWTLMQHHGAPTSVLDWSHSIFVALYFAVTGKPDLDCAIWAVHQKSLMSLASARGGSANDELFTEAAITSEQPLKLLAQDRYRPTTRMLAQQGTFTVATHNLADQADAIHECFLRQKELESHPLKREASIGLK